MDKFVTYVLYSKKLNKIYIGYTSSLIQRFSSHNHFAKKGFTIKYRPWKVVLVEFHKTKTDAIKREKILKSGMGSSFIRKEILALY